MSREWMGHLSEGPLSEILDGERFLNLRRKMQGHVWDLPTSKDNVRFPGCSPCHQREASGVKSRRGHWYESDLVRDQWRDETFAQMTENDILHLDLAFNDKCNFRCRMCNSAFSSRWRADEAELKRRGYPVMQRLLEEERQLDYDIVEQIKTILPRLRFLRRLEIVGGEPFLVPEFNELLDVLGAAGLKGGCELMITTNASLINEEHLKRLRGFKYVNLNVSIDATESLFEYTRSSGACSWQQINAQVRRVLDYCERMRVEAPGQIWKVNLNGAYQIYNMLNLKEFMDWIVDMFGWGNNPPSRLSKERHSFEHRLLLYPVCLNSQIVAPPELKREALRQVDAVMHAYPWLADISEGRFLTDIRKFLAIVPEPAEVKVRTQQFLDYTRMLDEMRGEEDQSFLKSHAHYFASATS